MTSEAAIARAADWRDALAVAQTLGPLPLAGFFCNGEIGPVGERPYLHGFTASIALILKDD